MLSNSLYYPGHYVPPYPGLLPQPPMTAPPKRIKAIEYHEDGSIKRIEYFA